MLVISQANGTYTVLTWNTERFDQNADFDLSNEQFSAPVSGKYNLQAQIRLENIDSAADYYIFRLSTSNESYKLLFDPDFGQDNVYWSMTLSVLADMDAGDVAKVSILQNGGTAQTDVDGDEEYTFFSGYLVA